MGTQLDNDEILDLQVTEGDRFSTSFTLDTSGLDANLQSFEVQTDQDLTEIEVASARTDFDETTFPEFEVVGTSTSENFSSAVFARNGSPGAEPDTVNVIVEGEATALENLTNDGQPDFGRITVSNAIDANGEDVTHLFQNNAAGIDLQTAPEEAVPQVSIKLEPTLIIEGRESQQLSFSFSEPVPTGGLEIATLLSDGDGQGDTVSDFESAQNIVDGELVTEDGQSILKFTIIEGATEASIDLAATEDNKAEGNEAFSLTLLPREGYTINAENNVANSVIADANAVIDSTDTADRLDGTDYADAIVGEAGNDVISGNGNNDALFGGNGSDRLFGDVGDDLLFGDEDKDTLIGGMGNDFLAGGGDEDRLIGVELNSSQPGINEQDTLTGGLGADTFILGNEAGIFYDDGDDSAAGNADFALISDFNPQEDRLELFGSAEQYSLEFESKSEGSSDARLVYNSGSDSATELVGLLENVSADLTIDDPGFTFV